MASISLDTRFIMCATVAMIDRPQIAELLKTGMPQAEIARRFDVTRQWIHIIARDVGLLGLSRAAQRKRTEEHRAGKREAIARHRAILDAMIERVRQGEKITAVARNRAEAEKLRRHCALVGVFSPFTPPRKGEGRRIGVQRPCF